MINESFYPLTPAIARKLREAKLTAAEWRIWSYLAEVDPWGDRYQDLDILAVLSECEVSKATFYRAIAKLQELNLFDFQDKGFSVRNRNGISGLGQSDGLRNEIDSQRLRKGYRKNETTFSEMRQESHSCENFLRNETTFSEMRQESHSCENRSPNRLPEAKLSPLHTPQTIQTPQTLQTGGGIEDPWKEEQVYSTGVQEQVFYSQEEEMLFNGVGEIQEKSVEEKLVGSEEVEKQVGEVQENLNREESQEEKRTEKSEAKREEKISRAQKINKKQKAPNRIKNTEIPQDLVNKLGKLEITLDNRVRKAIASHDISQAYSAVKHIEDTWETVNDPRAIFLYQISKKPVEKKKQRFSKEFLEWYQQAIAEGVVEDVPPEWLPTDHCNEPKVRLPKPDPVTGAPYVLVEWRRVRINSDYDPNQDMAPPDALKKIFENFKQQWEQQKQEQRKQEVMPDLW